MFKQVKPSNPKTNDKNKKEKKQDKEQSEGGAKEVNAFDKK